MMHCVKLATSTCVPVLANYCALKYMGGCGMVVAQWSEHWRLKPEALGSIPGGCPDVFSSNKLSDVDGVMSSVVL